MRTLVFVPTYNESQNLSPLVQALLDIDASCEVLVVDDASPDGTGEIADSLARKMERVHVMHRPTKLGLATAYMAGYRYGLEHSYDCVAQMDADFSHRPEDLPRLLEAVKSGAADVAIGSRNVTGGRVENWSLLRRFVSKGGSFYSRTLLKLPIKDCTSGFKCFRREVLEALDLDGVEAAGYVVNVEINYLCYQIGFRVVEIPIVFPDRVAGHSKLSGKIVLEGASMVWKLRHRQLLCPPEAPTSVVSRAIRLGDEGSKT